MRIATWNVNSIVARMPALVDWLARAEPDVLCLQELKTSTDAMPTEGIVEQGYEIAAYGTGRWNGVAILSRVGIEDVRRGLADEPGYQADEPPSLDFAETAQALEARAIGASCGGVRLWSVYVPNGREVGHPHYAYKLAWLDALTTTARDELTRYERFGVLGDFNIAPTDADVWDRALFTDSTHVTDPERAKLADLDALGLTDVPTRALKYDTPYTYWDYRGGSFHKNMGMRIDLAYLSAPLAAAVGDAWVDREARKGSVKSGKGPSDHAPVVVDLDV